MTFTGGDYMGVMGCVYKTINSINSRGLPRFASRIGVYKVLNSKIRFQNAVPIRPLIWK